MTSKLKMSISERFFVKRAFFSRSQSFLASGKVSGPRRSVRCFVSCKVLKPRLVNLFYNKPKLGLGKLYVPILTHQNTPFLHLSDGQLFSSNADYRSGSPLL